MTKRTILPSINRFTVTPLTSPSSFAVFMVFPSSKKNAKNSFASFSTNRLNRSATLMFSPHQSKINGHVLELINGHFQVWMTARAHTVPARTVQWPRPTASTSSVQQSQPDASTGKVASNFSRWDTLHQPGWLCMFYLSSCAGQVQVCMLPRAKGCSN